MVEPPDCAYLYVRPGPRVARTITITESVLADIDRTGRILGVEVIGGPITIAHLRAVLFRAYL